ncbi:MAG: hypothetical protein L3J52_06245 [Proteobacteria bacterium]|nr:hypothetical protein [Pseudomonadota bacterium]
MKPTLQVNLCKARSFVRWVLPEWHLLKLQPIELYAKRLVNCDYDRLLELSNYHNLFRQMLGHSLFVVLDVMLLWLLLAGIYKSLAL